ncbi:MAG TPA: class II aldolase/adducin family protein [Bryobacteraceae bacterium]|nr:class II aldolase/adducin family protein [Bryobacteraceae bacterium]
MAYGFLHPRDEILEAMERIYRYRMTTTSGGNLSIREPEGDVWITPARVDKGGLRREDIVCVHPDGTLEGERRPSSELPLHQAIYRARPDVRGIVHAHPVALVAFSLARAVPDTRLFHQARQVCGEGGFAAYELPGSEALGNTVAATFHQGYDCVILENHGVVTAGVDLPEAFRRFETFEFTGKTIIKARLSGRQVRYLSDAEIEMAKGRVGAMAGFHRDAPSSREKELRRRLCEFVRRAYRQRLFISTQGSFSARLSEDSFLITPYRVDRGAIAAEDLVLVQSGKAEAGANPSRAANIHDAIYRAHPEVGAVINAYPVNATAFSVTGGEIDTRTIPESYIVVRHPAVAPYGLQFEDAAAIAVMIAADRPALILENDGVLVTGRDVLEAFDRLEVLESTAEALINARAVGALSPMPEDVIRELERVFLGVC